LRDEDVGCWSELLRGRVLGEGGVSRAGAVVGRVFGEDGVSRGGAVVGRVGRGGWGFADI